MGGDHQCPVCQATFTRPQHVARHMRSHTGDRPYKCTYCGDQFARSDLLSRHVNKCHANERPPPAPPGSRRKGPSAIARALTSKQACDQCVQASTPCDGANPCAKCVHRKVRCTFVKFHRQTAPAGPGHNAPPDPNAVNIGLASSYRLPPFADEFLQSNVAVSQSQPEFYPPFYSFPVFSESSNPPNADLWLGWLDDSVANSVPDIPSTANHQRYASASEFPPQEQFILHPPSRRRASFGGGSPSLTQASLPSAKAYRDDPMPRPPDQALTTLQQQQRLIQQRQQQLLELQHERRRRQGEAFSSAFGLLSIEDPNVLTGLATDGAPFFSNLPQNAIDFSGRPANSLISNQTDVLPDPVPTPRPSTSGSTVSTTSSEASASKTTSHSSSSSLSGALAPPISGREAELGELRAFWKAYMRTPGTPLPPNMHGGPTAGGQMSHPASGLANDSAYRRTRVSSLPTATPNAERHGFVGQVAAGGTYDGMGEDLTSYEAAIRARGVPPALTLLPKRRLGGAGLGSISVSPVNNGPGVISQTQQSSVQTPRPLGWESASDSYQFPLSNQPFAENNQNRWRQGSPGTASDTDEDINSRPSFKRLPSQTLEQATTKRVRDINGVSSDADHNEYVSYLNPARGPEWGTERWGDWEVHQGLGNEQRARSVSAPGEVSPGSSPALPASHPIHQKVIPAGCSAMVGGSVCS